jgi:hypothetical protein
MSNAKMPTQVPMPLFLVAATNPDSKGRVSFEGLPPAFYMVGVLLPESAGSSPQRVTVTGALRVVDLSKDRKRDDAGTITIAVR